MECVNLKLHAIVQKSFDGKWEWLVEVGDNVGKIQGFNMMMWGECNTRKEARFARNQTYLLLQLIYDDEMRRQEHGL